MLIQSEPNFGRLYIRPCSSRIGDREARIDEKGTKAATLVSWVDGQDSQICI